MREGLCCLTSVEASRPVRDGINGSISGVIFIQRLDCLNVEEEEKIKVSITIKAIWPAE